MRRFASPAMLFAIAALLIGLPGLQRLAKPPPMPRVQVNVIPPPGAKPDALPPHGAVFLRPTVRANPTGGVQSFTPVGPLGVVLFASLPLFALAYALWPRALGRALRPDLGRWHAAFAVIPTLLAPVLGFLVIALLSPIAFRAAGANPQTLLPSLTSWITTFIASIHYAIAFLWLTGLLIFSVNAVLTMRRRGESGG